MRWGAVLLIYATLGLGAGWAAASVHGTLWTHPEPWLDLGPVTSHLYSAVIGLTLGLAVVAATGPLARRTHWVRVLYEELQPLAQGMRPVTILFVALLSSLGEELLFRSLLQPWVTVWGQAVLFGLAHQLPGRARWIWVVWATIMGLVLGTVYQATGSLVGPLIAHATINGLNLLSLQQPKTTHDRRSMGGVLGQQRT